MEKDKIDMLINIPMILPYSAERHKNSKPPEEAYYFFPKGNDIVVFDINQPNKTRRKIFEAKGDDSILPYEIERLAFFREELKNYDSNDELILPENWKDINTLRFLQASSYDNIKTISSIKEHLEWRKLYFPIKINEKSETILKYGFIYIHGRDNHYRPIIVIDAGKYSDLKKIYAHEDFVIAIIYLMEYMIMFMLIPGQVENWNIICDLNNASIASVSSDLYNMLTILQSNYRARLNVVYVLGMNKLLSVIWTIVTKYIDSNTHKKIKFVYNNSKNELFEFINREQVEKKYGGTAKNIGDLQEYFPPIMPSSNYLKDDNDRYEMLVTKKKYIQLYRENKLAVVSPYIIVLITNNLKQEADSVYEDARSYYPEIIDNKSYNRRQNSDDISVYENCKELDSVSSNINTNLLEIENNKINKNIYKEYLENSPKESIKDLPNKINADDYKDIINEYYSQHLNENIETVRGSNIKVKNTAVNTYNNFETFDTLDKNSQISNNSLSDKKKEIVFESDMKKQCCVTTYNCIIY